MKVDNLSLKEIFQATLLIKLYSMNFIGKYRLFLTSILIPQAMKLVKEENNLWKLIKKGNIRIWIDTMCPDCFVDSVLLVWPNATRKVSKPWPSSMHMSCTHAAVSQKEEVKSKDVAGYYLSTWINHFQKIRLKVQLRSNKGKREIYCWSKWTSNSLFILIKIM